MSPRTIPIASQILLCTYRGFARLRNNYIPVVAGIFANVIIAIVVGSVFFNLEQSTDSMDKRAVLLFFSLMITAFAPAFEVCTSSHVSLPHKCSTGTKNILDNHYVGTTSYCG